MVLGSALLRTSGIDYLLPEVMNRDGLVIIRQIEFFRSHEHMPAKWEWWYTAYPHLMARIASLWPAVEVGKGQALSLEQHLQLARAPWVQVRILSVVLSLLAVPGTYLLARRFLDRMSSLFAAGLVATSLHHICLSIQEKPHAAATSFVLLALLAALRLRRRPDVLSYFLCGLTAALAVGILHNGIICLLPLAAAFLLRDRREIRVSKGWIAIPIAMVALSTRLFYPFLFEGIRGPALPAQAGADLLSLFQGAPCLRILGALWGLDPLLVTAASAGVLLWSFRARPDGARILDAVRGDLAVLLALVLPYLLVLGLFQGTLVRFLLPLLPVLACAAGFAFSRASSVCFSRLRSGRLHASLSAALGAALLAVPLWPAWHFARIRRQPGPLAEAARWIALNVDPREVVVVVPHYDVPLLPTREAIAENARLPYRTIWSEYLARASPESLEGTRRPILVEPGDRPDARLQLMRDPLAYLHRWGARYAVLDLSGGGAELLRGKASRSARFSPARHDDDRDRGMVLFGTGYDPLAPTAWSILRSRALGTTVEIYRLP